MAASITAYDHLWKLVLTGQVDLDTDTLKVVLVTSSYTPATSHTIYDPGTDDAADVSYNEAANGDGYTTGGVALTGATVAAGTIDYADPVWNSLTKTFRYAICYADKTTGGGLVKPLLFYILLDTTPANIVSSGSNYTIQWNDTNKLFYRPA